MVASTVPACWSWRPSLITLVEAVAAKVRLPSLPAIQHTAGTGQAPVEAAHVEPAHAQPRTCLSQLCCAEGQGQGQRQPGGGVGGCEETWEIWGSVSEPALPPSFLCGEVLLTPSSQFLSGCKKSFFHLRPYNSVHIMSPSVAKK